MVKKSVKKSKKVPSKKAYSDKGSSKSSSKKNYSAKSSSSRNKSVVSSNTVSFKKPNLRVVVAIILILIVLVFVSKSFFHKDKSGRISEAEATQLILDFVAKQGASATLINSSKKSSIYEVFVLIDEQEVPIYITKDGAYLIPAIVPYDDAMNTP